MSRGENKIYKKPRNLPYENTYVIFAPRPAVDPIPLGLRPELEEGKYCLLVKIIPAEESDIVRYGFEVYNMPDSATLAVNFCRVAGEYLAFLGYVNPYHG